MTQWVCEQFPSTWKAPISFTTVSKSSSTLPASTSSCTSWETSGSSSVTMSRRWELGTGLTTSRSSCHASQFTSFRALRPGTFSPKLCHDFGIHPTLSSGTKGACGLYKWQIGCLKCHKNSLAQLDYLLHYSAYLLWHGKWLLSDFCTICWESICTNQLAYYFSLWIF